MKELDAETRRILAAITEETWIRYYHELVIYAQRKCSRLYWRTGGRECLPAGYSDPEAIAREAVTRLFEGSAALESRAVSRPQPRRVPEGGHRQRGFRPGAERRA